MCVYAGEGVVVTSSSANKPGLRISFPKFKSLLYSQLAYEILDSLVNFYLPHLCE